MTTEAGRQAGRRGPLQGFFQWGSLSVKEGQKGKRGSIASIILFVASWQENLSFFFLLLHVIIAKAPTGQIVGMPSLFEAAAQFAASHWLPAARNPDDAFTLGSGGGRTSCVCVVTSYPCPGERIRRKMLEYEVQKIEQAPLFVMHSQFDCSPQDIVAAQVSRELR